MPASHKPLTVDQIAGMQPASALHKPMTVDEVASYTGIAAATLRYYRSARRGPRSYKLGRRVVYDPADVDAWVAQQKAATSAGGDEEAPFR